jgi:hypothetical protein
MKLTFITIFAIAFWGLPETIAQSAAPKAIADFTSNPALGERHTSSQLIADLVEAPDTGTPGNERTAGGSRGGGCKQKGQSFTALVPEKSTQSLTTAEYPVFWFYIPDAPKDIDSIEFSLHDKDDSTTLYRTSLQLTQAPGAIGIPLPPSPENSLKVNESYHWRFIVHCAQKTTEEEDPMLEGRVTRVEPSLKLNSSAVFWHDELTDLAKRYLLEPQNAQVKDAWSKLMQSVGLTWLAQERPIQLLNTSKK